MATTPYAPAPLPYQPYQAPIATNPIGFSSPTDARKLAANQRAVTQGQGDALMANDQALANQYAQQASGTQNYLNPIENTLAQGGGGYNQNEASQITLSPQDKQNIITGAGISAGAGTAASVGAAERAAAAAGGNPEALATYRARAAQTEGANAGDAMTKARIEAQQAGSQGAQTVGNARLAQQNQGLGYYGGLQAQQQSNALQEQALGQGAFGTTVGGTGQAAGLGVQASQTPSGFDKLTGAIAGGLGSGLGGGLGLGLAALADGSSGYFGDGVDAVLGEDGPEVIVEHASDPVRSHTKFMANGTAEANTDDPGDWAAPAPSPKPAPNTPSWLSTAPPWLLHQYLASTERAAPAQQQQPQWNKTTPYDQMGTAAGQVLGPLVMAKMLAARKNPSPFAQGSSQMPAPGTDYSSAQMHGSALPEGIPGGRSLENRTGESIDGVPSLPEPQNPYPTYGDTTMAPDLSTGMYADGGTALYADGRNGDYLADGSALATPPMAPKFDPSKIITSPTRVHLDKGDQVVPLSYRPKAKIRPSAAFSPVPSVEMKPRLRHTYGGVRAA